MPYFYKRSDIENKSQYNDIAEEELSTGLQNVFVDVPKENARIIFDYVDEREKIECRCDLGTCKTEKRFCRCLYFFNNAKKSEKELGCNNCCIKKDYKLAKKIVNAEVMDFEVPVSQSSKDSIGEIDLLMKYNNKVYCVEFKPIWNEESLLRMVAEIVTYTYVLNGGVEAQNEKFKQAYDINCYKKAIMFMEGSEQYYQWFGEKDGKKYQHLARKGMRELIRENDITVFLLEGRGGKYIVKDVTDVCPKGLQ